MAQKVNLFKLLTKKPLNYILILFVVILSAILALGFMGNSKIRTDKIEKVEISGKGRSITINQNGVVEIKTEEGTVYQTLDSSKLANLFAYIKKKADSPQKYKKDSLENIIKIILVIDGKERIIYIDADDPEFQQIIEDILNPDTEGGPIGDYFGDDDTPPNPDGDDTLDPGFFDGNPTPTPTPFGLPPSGGDQVSPAIYLPPGVTNPGGDCTGWNDQIIGKAVISNTVCFKQVD